MNCSYLSGPRSHICKVAGSLGKGTEYPAFTVTRLAMTGLDSEARDRLFSRFSMGHTGLPRAMLRACLCV